AITPVVALAHDADAQEVVPLHVESDGDDVQGHGRVGDAAEGGCPVCLPQALLPTTAFVLTN
ncbi:hypothetical protein OFC37_35875, partial [Escherichia coli]|nr:hypothetical protein [Escherichia coli]